MLTARDKFLQKAETVCKRNDPYIWSGQGQLLRKTPIDKMAAMETSEENFKRVAAFIYRKVSAGFKMKNSRMWDCSGLVTYLLIKLHIIPGDTNAQGLYDKYTRHKSLDTVYKGDLVFKGSDVNHITHVGIYTDDGIIEAKGRDWGVVKSVFKKSEWLIAGDPFDILW